VYLGELEAELGFRRTVAVKIVGEGSAGADRAVKSLANEARALAAAHHPNVVLVYDLVRVEGEYLLVMEYVEGPTLSSAIRNLARRNQTLSVGEALLVAEQMADGLACVHELLDHEGEPAPIVHRDLKPSNVILSQHGQAKLVDFGLAKGKLVAFHTVVPNITRGTPGYMSPEQVRGEELTPASDQFALGAILYEMVTSLPLFHDRSEMDLLKRVVEGRPSSDPEALRRACPELVPMVTRCLSLDASQRFSQTHELAMALRELRKRLGLDADLRALVARLEGRDAPAASSDGPEFIDLSPGDAAVDSAVPASPTESQALGQGTEMFFFGDSDTAPELDPLFDVTKAAPPATVAEAAPSPPPEQAVPPTFSRAGADPTIVDSAPARASRFRDMMTHDVSFHMAQPVGKKMRFSKPKTEAFGPSQFDLVPVSDDDVDVRDSEDDDAPPPPWELDD